MKSEKEKMLNGEPYFSGGEELSKERMHCRKIIKEYNDSDPEDLEFRKELLKSLFGKTGENIYIEPNFRCDYGYNIELGDNFYANFDCVFLDCAKIKIGNNVMIAPGVHIYTATHPLNTQERISLIEMAYPVTIEDNVWIGGGVIINPGVTIGKNSVIGSGSVVTKNIPENVLAAGNPCKVIKNI